jgi:hypothetical protein
MSSLLALAILGGTTEEIGLFLVFVKSPKVAKASKYIDCPVADIFAINNIANVQADFRFQRSEVWRIKCQTFFKSSQNSNPAKKGQN